jgi:integrase
MARDQINHRRFGNVRRLPSGRYQARWAGPDGYVHKAPATFATADEADAWLAGELVARATNSWVDERRGATAFGELAAQWKAETVHKRPSTLARDHGYLDRYLTPAFGPLAVADIDAAAVASWQAGLLAAGLAAATIGKARQVLAAILDIAIRDKRLAGDNPVGLVKGPKIDDAEMMVLDRAQIADLADAIDPRYRALVIVACHTGLRMGELVGLVAGDVDLLRRRLTVTRNITEVNGTLHFGPLKTKAGRRVVPLSAEAVEALTPMVGGAGHRDDILFTAPRGGFLRPGAWRARFWYPALEAAGLEGLRCHDMRHTAVTLWCQAGIDPKTIATWAGHASVVTVLDRYAHWLPNRDDENLARLDAYISAG